MMASILSWVSRRGLASETQNAPGSRRAAGRCRARCSESTIVIPNQHRLGPLRNQVEPCQTPRASPDREGIKQTTGKDRNQCLFLCACTECGAKGIVCLNTPLHFIRGEDLEERLSISVVNSPVRFFRVALSSMLFRSRLCSDNEMILAGAPEAGK